VNDLLEERYQPKDKVKELLRRRFLEAAFRKLIFSKKGS